MSSDLGRGPFEVHENRGFYVIRCGDEVVARLSKQVFSAEYVRGYIGCIMDASGMFPNTRTRWCLWAPGARTAPLQSTE